MMKRSKEGLKIKYSVIITLDAQDKIWQDSKIEVAGILAQQKIQHYTV